MPATRIATPIDMQEPSRVATRARRSSRAIVAAVASIATAACLAAACSRADAGSREPSADDRAPHVAASSLEAAGEYLTTVAGCNDCHTPRWVETGGKVPPSDRMIGSAAGMRGPRGTSHPANPRLSVRGRTAAQWVEMLRARSGESAMPWSSVHAMSDRDLRAIYVYLRALGPVSARADME